MLQCLIQVNVILKVRVIGKLTHTWVNNDSDLVT